MSTHPQSFADLPGVKRWPFERRRGDPLLTDAMIYIEEHPQYKHVVLCNCPETVEVVTRFVVEQLERRAIGFTSSGAGKRLQQALEFLESGEIDVMVSQAAPLLGGWSTDEKRIALSATYLLDPQEAIQYIHRIRGSNLFHTPRFIRYVDEQAED